MNLTAVQEDALIEVINIGFGRAAASLSKLTGQRVQLEVPHIAMCPIDELSDRLRPDDRKRSGQRSPDLLRRRSSATRCWSSISRAPPFSRSC